MERPLLEPFKEEEESIVAGFLLERRAASLHGGSEHAIKVSGWRSNESNRRRHAAAANDNWPTSPRQVGQSSAAAPGSPRSWMNLAPLLFRFIAAAAAYRFALRYPASSARLRGAFQFATDRARPDAAARCFS